MDALGVEWKYEAFKFEYIVPPQHYTPDFWIKNQDGTEEFLEVKGYFDPQARLKMQLFKEQHPEVRLALHFMKPLTKINPRSKLTYKDWAEKHGYQTREF